MEEQKLPKKELIHDLSSQKRKSNSMGKQLVVTIIIVLILGIGTGYIATNVSGNGARPTAINSNPQSSDIKKGFTTGVSDTKSFTDTAEGVVKEGGLDGEGEYHLVRPGGDSQNVYMTSSVVDLSKFVGKTIKVWGQTQTAQKAGWLMDVGKVEVK